MTFAVFTEEMTRIGKVFGQDKYPRDRVDIIWRSLQRISNTKFPMVVDELIANHRQAPMLKEFAEAAAKIREPRANTEDQPDRVLCKLCNDTGATLYRDKDEYEFATQCVCQNGTQFGESVRRALSR